VWRGRPRPRTAESVEIAGSGWPTLFVDIIQLRPPRSRGFRRPGIPAAATFWGFDLLRCERIIPSHIPNLHLRQQKLIHQDRPRSSNHNLEKLLTKSITPHRIIYAKSHTPSGL